MKKNDKIYLSKEGYNELLNKIDNLAQQIKKVNSGRNEAYAAGGEDGWDSPEFETIEMIDRALAGQLTMLKNELMKVEIIDKHNNNDVIDIDDIIVADISYSENSFEELTFKLVGGSVNRESDLDEVSLNSPMGKAIYKKKIGDTVSYIVEDTKMTIKIKEKIDLEKDHQNPVKSL